MRFSALKSSDSDIIIEFRLLFFFVFLWIPTANATSNYIDMTLIQLDLLAEVTLQLSVDIGRAPEQPEWPDILVSNNSFIPGWDGPYLKNIPIDPWGNEFRYILQPSDNKKYFWGILSAGENGLYERGQKDDISTWLGYSKKIYFPDKKFKHTLNLLLAACVLVASGWFFWIMSRCLGHRNPDQ